MVHLSDRRATTVNHDRGTIGSADTSRGTDQRTHAPAGQAARCRPNLHLGLLRRRLQLRLHRGGDVVPHRLHGRRTGGGGVRHGCVHESQGAHGVKKKKGGTGVRPHASATAAAREEARRGAGWFARITQGRARRLRPAVHGRKRGSCGRAATDGWGGRRQRRLGRAQRR